MAKRDIFKIDNYLITIGILFLIVGIISIAADPRTYNDLTIFEGNTFYFEDYNGRSLDEVKSSLSEDSDVMINGLPILRFLFALSGLTFIIVGKIIRTKENKIIAIWNNLDLSNIAKVRDLEQSLGYTKSFILENLRHINAQHGAFYVYVEDKDSIVDGRLLKEYPLSTKCSGCGNGVSKLITLTGFDLPKCDYCGNPVSGVEIMNLRNDLLNKSIPIPDQNDFNIVIFIVLLIFFWPGAFIYLYVKKKKSLNTADQQLNQFQNLIKGQVSALKNSQVN